MAVVVAECGTEHVADTREQRFENAISLVRIAARAGADVVKFQYFIEGEALFCPMHGDKERWRRWSRSVMSFHSWQDVAAEAHRRKMRFALSTFQERAVRQCTEAGIPQKVAVRALHAFPYSQAGKIFAISQPKGQEIIGNTNAYRLSCAPGYPCTMKDAVWDGTMDGISDHSGSPWPAADALLRGAECVEVHLTPSKAGPDGASGLTAEQLKIVCEARDAATLMR